MVDGNIGGDCRKNTSSQVGTMKYLDNFDGKWLDDFDERYLDDFDDKPLDYFDDRYWNDNDDLKLLGPGRPSAGGP